MWPDRVKELMCYSQNKGLALKSQVLCQKTNRALCPMCVLAVNSFGDCNLWDSLLQDSMMGLAQLAEKGN